VDELRPGASVMSGNRYAAARSRLADAQKSAASVPAYLRFVNRRAGGWLASVGYALDLTPTQLTVLSAVSSFAGIAVLLFAPATVPIGLLVAALLLLGYALDSADGQLARIRGGGSKAGEWLDHVVDIAKLTSLHAVVTVSVLRHFDVSRLALALPLVFGIANATQFLGMMLRDQLRGSRQLTKTGSSSVLVALLLLPLDHGTLCLAFVLLGYHTAFLVCYGLLALCTVLFAARSLTKAYRGLLALDRAGSPG
jgi:phosphatidylglycerophosphate synthase